MILKEISVVCFDLGETLVTHKHAPNPIKVDRKILARIGMNPSEEEIKEAKKKIEEEAWKTRGRAKPLGFFYSEMLKRLGKNVRFEKAKELQMKFIDKMVEHHSLINGAKKVLAALQKKYKLALLSNGDVYGFRKIISKFDLEKYFDWAKVSEEIGFEKSDYIPFQKLFKYFNVHPKECVMIGDYEQEDIRPANKLGMKTIKLGLEAKSEANFQIKELPELLKIL